MANVIDCEYGKTNFWNKGGQIQVYHAFIDTVTMDSDILNSAWFIMHKRHKKKEKSKFKVKIDFSSGSEDEDENDDFFIGCHYEDEKEEEENDFDDIIQAIQECHIGDSNEIGGNTVS